MTFDYKYKEGCLYESEGIVEHCCGNLVGTDESTGYEASVTIMAKKPGSLSGGFVAYEDLTESNLAEWLDAKLASQQAPDGYANQKAFYMQHIEKIIVRDLANKADAPNRPKAATRGSKLDFMK